MESVGVGVGFGGRRSAVSGIGKRRQRSLMWVLGSGCSFADRRKGLAYLGYRTLEGRRGTIRK
jgi:hypothetical protein